MPPVCTTIVDETKVFTNNEKNSTSYNTLELIAAISSPTAQSLAFRTESHVLYDSTVEI